MVRFLVNFVSPSSGRLNMTWPTNQHLWKEISFNRSQRYFWHLRALKKGTKFLARDQLLLPRLTTYSAHLHARCYAWVQDSNPGHIVGRWAFSSLCHPLKYYVAQILEPHWVSSLPAFLLSLEFDILPFILTNIVYILVLGPEGVFHIYNILTQYCVLSSASPDSNMFVHLILQSDLGSNQAAVLSKFLQNETWRPNTLESISSHFQWVSRCQSQRWVPAKLVEKDNP